MNEPTACTEAGKQMIARLGEAVDHPNAKIRCERMKGVLREAVEADEKLIKRSHLTSNGQQPQDYARHLLYLDPDDRFSLLGMLWEPGQKTPLHDHAGVWCVECVSEGRIEVTSYDVIDEDEQGHFHFQEESSVISGIGDAGALIPPFEYHQIENTFDQTAITLHVYKGEMTHCNVFEPTDSGGYRKVKKSLSYSEIHHNPD